MKLRLIFVCMMYVFLTACQQEVQTEKRLSENSQSEKYPVTINSHQAGYSSKPHASVFMHYEFLNEVLLNEPLDVRVTFKVGLNTDRLQVEVVNNSALKILSSQTVFLFNNLLKGDVQSIVLSVMPTQAGENSIVLSAGILLHGENQSRTFVVPVTIDDSKTAKSQTKIDGKGMIYKPQKNIISMPAAESR